MSCACMIRQVGKKNKKLREPTTLVLVRVVPTVIVVVTLPAARHAAVDFTAELVRLTCPLICV